MDIFGIGPMELLVVAVLALLVFGPGKLPEIAAGAGKALREFPKVTSEVTSEFSSSMNAEREQPADPAPSTFSAAPQPTGFETPSATETRTCTLCSAQNPVKNRFCAECGHLLA